MLKVIVSFISLFLAFNVFSLDIDKLEVPASFTSKFSQTRHITATDLTLKSSGRVELKDGGKLSWIQQEPFPYLILMESDNVSAGTQGNLKAVNEPVTKYMAKIMFNLFKGDLTQLKSIFNIKSLGKSIVLTPKDETMKKFMSKVEIEGKNHIESIRLIEVSGNWLEIKFEKLQRH